MEVTEKEGNNGECLFLIPPQLSGQASVCERQRTPWGKYRCIKTGSPEICLHVQEIRKLTQVYKKSRPHWRAMN